MMVALDMNRKDSQTIIVTGGAGFIGSTFLNLVVPKYPKNKFINLDSLTSVSDLSNVTVSDASNYTFKKVDIRDMTALDFVFKEYTPTHIIHFAAESHVDVSIENPSIFIETNILGTHNLLSLALSNKIEKFVHISTDEVYGSLSVDDTPFTESSVLAPNSPYSASKASSDLLVRTYNKTYGLNAVITRCSNNYGPRQDDTKFIPRAITSLLRDEKIPVYGVGENIRDWIYVEDHARAIDLVWQNGTSGEVYNIGGSHEETNIDIANILSKLLGKTDEIEFVEDRKGHDFRYAVDSTKITTELNWQPITTFEVGIQKTLNWYRGQRS